MRGRRYSFAEVHFRYECWSIELNESALNPGMLKLGLNVARSSFLNKHGRLNICQNRYFSADVGKCLLELAPAVPRTTAFDTKSIRANESIYSQNCLNRNYKDLVDYPRRIARSHEQWVALEKDVSETRRKTKAVEAKLSSNDVAGREELLEQARRLRETLSKTGDAQRRLSDEVARLSQELPNLTSIQSPAGTEPRILETIEPRQDHEPLRDHVRIGTALGLLDFSAAATTSGWGFYFLLNEAEKLEHALVQYARSVAQQRGFKPVSPPSMIYSDIGTSCGFRPRDQNGEQQVYGIQQSERDLQKDKPSHSLAGTAEIPFAAMWANNSMDCTSLPHRVVGSSRCYRAEAGARGRETRGLYRVHEFTKVEMFAWTMPGEETSVFEEMVSIQKQIIRALGLPFRHLEMAAYDLGASAYRKQDIEVFFPSRRDLNGGWGEVTSTSICTDYQTRRLHTRVKMPPGSDTKYAYPSTVNGTAMAVPRVLAAILENGWDGKEVVKIPEVLWPWMDGQKTIGKREE